MAGLIVVVPRLRYKYGTYTLEIHGSSNFSGRCDVVNITVPASVWAKSSDPETVQQELKDAFAMVDVDGSGEIDQGELRGLAQMLGMELTNADLVSQFPRDASRSSDCLCASLLIAAWSVAGDRDGRDGCGR